jgi:predicted glycosyltransferase involved in capsule biosynthesis
MKHKLTTITAYWRRPEMLRSWVRALRDSAHPEVLHFIYFVGEYPPEWWCKETTGTSILALIRGEAPELSIGHYHNLGAQQAPTEWIMKLDVDTLPHPSYFEELLPILESAQPREWFNGGMFYLNRRYSELLLTGRSLTHEIYRQIMDQRRTYSANSYLLPAATNFICLRDEYLALGGCDSGFSGYGWEDYQQIYMLERNQLQKDPLPGLVTIDNVTQRCRDSISRRKARELWERNSTLCLIHKWHASTIDPRYHASMKQNRELLLRYILQSR